MSVRVEVWADIRCPWCWMGHRQLAAAIEQVSVEVHVHHRSFLLEPNGPAESRRPIRRLAIESWGMSAEEWDTRRDRIQGAGAALGLSIHMDTARAIDSRPVHRLLKWAVTQGIPPERMWELAFAAHLEHNEDLEDPAALRALGARAGLDPTDVKAFLDTDAFAEEVTRDHQEGLARGVRSVPTFQVGAQTLTGHRTPEDLATLLKTGTQVG